MLCNYFNCLFLVCVWTIYFICLFLNTFTCSFIISKQLGPHSELFASFGVLTLYLSANILVLCFGSFLIYNSHRKDSWLEFYTAYSLQWSIAPLG